MFSAAWFICKDLFRLLTHSTNIWPRVSSAVVFCFFLFTFFIIIIFIFFVALRCRLLHLASRASITRGSLTATTGSGMLQCCKRSQPLPPMRCLLLKRHVATPCMGRHLLSPSTPCPSSLPSRLRLPACLPGQG